ncbi:MAG: MBL fold metallo-hydrolase [Synergistes sp.]|nr:MBL fold metallo-hydrolase [Synergistes sp.]
MKTIRKIPYIVLPACITLLVIFALSAAADPGLRYYGVDVGQGDCSLFILPGGETIVIDAGPEKTSRRTMQYIKSCGVRKIDLLVATHPHEDHIGGMRTLMAAFPVGMVWDSGYNYGSYIQERFYRDIKKRNIPFKIVSRGYSARLGNVELEVLAPARRITGTRSDANNNSIIMLITYGNISFLMTGDMEREEYASIRPLPRATVLKAAHHGSCNSTSRQLMLEVSPEIVVLNYEKGNSYGYPHKETVAEIRRSGARRFDTADGTVKLYTDGTSLIFDGKREVK